jgi:hypothetical protein
LRSLWLYPEDIIQHSLFDLLLLHYKHEREMERERERERERGMNSTEDG